MATTARQLEQFAESLEPAFRKAFLDAIAQVTDKVGVQLIADLLQAGRVDDVLQVLGLDDARFSSLADQVRSAYMSGGTLGAAEMPALRVSLAPVITGSYRPTSVTKAPAVEVRFNLRNPVAEKWVNERSSALITNIVEDQRVMIREALANGLAKGDGPRQTALEIVGRIDATGRRSGGTIGLTSQQAKFVRNMRDELASGDTKQMANYFTRTLRDKRFDGIVKRAMAAGKPVSAADIEKLAGRYSDRLLKYRGDAIARSESLNALRAGQEEAYRQQIETGKLAPENVIGTWSTSGDDRVRHSHVELDGQKRVFGEPFVTPSGARLNYPGDESLGAGPEEIIMCRCKKTYSINYGAEALRNGR